MATSDAFLSAIGEPAEPPVQPAANGSAGGWRGVAAAAGRHASPAAVRMSAAQRLLTLRAALASVSAALWCAARVAEVAEALPYPYRLPLDSTALVMIDFQ